MNEFLNFLYFIKTSTFSSLFFKHFSETNNQSVFLIHRKSNRLYSVIKLQTQITLPSLKAPSRKVSVSVKLKVLENKKNRQTLAPTVSAAERRQGRLFTQLFDHLTSRLMECTDAFMLRWLNENKSQLPGFKTGKKRFLRGEKLNIKSSYLFNHIFDSPEWSYLYTNSTQTLH